MMFADDIVICSESREQVGENLARRGSVLERREWESVTARQNTYSMCEMKVDEWNSEVVGSKAEKVNEFKDSGSIV